MAHECFDLSNAIDNVRYRSLDSSSIDQLDNARKYLPYVGVFLFDLEKFCPKNGISTQLRPLFIEAHDGFCKILSNMEDRGILMKLFKLQPEEMIPEVLKIIKLENIADQLRASKPSRSSSRITMEMVCLVKALLGWTAYRPIPSALKKKLRYLRIFLTLTANRCIEHASMENFFTRAKNVAYDVARLCFLGFAYNMDSEFSELLERLSPFRYQLRKDYWHVLIGLK